MNRPAAWMYAAVSLAFVGSAVVGCDALIGIEELHQDPGPTGTTCETPADCPATGNACYVRACAGGQCELREVTPGLPIQDATPGDCKQQVCNSGAASDQVDTSDVPSDGNACTVEACDANGSPQSGFAPAGTPCPEAGVVCDGAGMCVACVGPEQCNANQDCVNFVCIGADCDDTMQNGGETDIDCGGPDCPKCANNKTCEDANDCLSGVCSSSGGGAMTCRAPTCSDGVQNGLETDEDCGGGCPNGCDTGERCEHSSDCRSKVCLCEENTCMCAAPSCDDGVKNGNEVASDCGEDCVGQCNGNGCCDDGEPCDNGEWCLSRSCSPEGVCLPPTCEDGIFNGLEEAEDCGAPVDCPPCGG